jgi:chemotaxis protein MotB
LARKKKHAEHANHERWLVSYADFITLLFAFFVVMFASSQTDKAKAQHISDSVTEALDKGGIQAVVHEVLGGTVDEKGKGNAQMKGPGGSEPKNVPNVPEPTDKELLPKLMYLNKALEAEIHDGKLEIKEEPRGLVIRLAQGWFFPSGDDNIDPKTYEAIAKIAKVIGDGPNQIRLEGHTDARPIHTARFPSNYYLSSARGIAMLNLLSEKFGIAEERLAVVGYAAAVPIATNDTEEGRAKNRRVEIVILNQRVASPPGVAQPPSPPPPLPAPPKKK